MKAELYPELFEPKQITTGPLQVSSHASREQEYVHEHPPPPLWLVQFKIVAAFRGMHVSRLRNIALESVT